MPLGAFKATMLGAAGSGSSDHFIGWWDWSAGGSGDYRILGEARCDVNSDGDMIVQGGFADMTGGGNYQPLMVYINNDTTIKWEKTVGEKGVRDSQVHRGGVKFDANGDIWAASAGTYNQTGWNTDTGGYTGMAPFVLQQYDKTDGSLDQDRIFFKPTNYDDNFGSLATAGSNAAWSGFRSSDAGTMTMKAMEISDISSNYMQNTISSPNGGAQLVYGGGGTGDYWAVTGTFWRDIGGATSYRPAIIARGTSETDVTYNLFYDAANTSTAIYGYGITMDSSGNKYWAVQDSSLSPSWILKVSGTTSGSMSIDWQNAYKGTYSTNYFAPNNVAIDSSGNSYTVGYVEATVASHGGTHGFIMKHNDSGTLQWSRMFTPVHSGTGKNSAIYDVAVTDDDESIVVSGTLADSNNYNQMMVAKLPADGSGTGDYVTGTDAGTISYYNGSSHITTDSRTLTASSQTVSTGASVTINSEPTALTVASAHSDLGTYRTESV